MAKAAKLPKTQAPKAKPPSAKGPKLDKPANANTPRQSSAPKQLEYKPDLKSKQYRALGNVNRATPPDKINLPDRNPFSSKLKPQAAPSTAKPEGTGRFTDKLKKAADIRSGATKAASAAESTASKAVRVASPYLKTAGKLMGRANIAVDMIANAQPTNQGESEWLKNKGPLMKGNKKYNAPIGPDKHARAGGARPSPSIGSNKTLTGPGGASSNTSMGMSFNGGTATGAKAMGMSFNGGAAPASSTSDSKYKKGSYTELAYKPTGTAEKRVGGKVTSTTTQAQSGTPASRMQSRYQRDSGLAMDSRKKK